ELYAVADPPRVWRAIKRRLGLKVAGAQQAELLDYSPYESPFHSPEDLRAMIPAGMEPLAFRCQGFIGLKEFPQSWQRRSANAIASFVVSLDSRMSDRHPEDWSGGAIFAALRRTGPASA